MAEDKTKEVTEATEKKPAAKKPAAKKETTAKTATAKKAAPKAASKTAETKKATETKKPAAKKPAAKTAPKKEAAPKAKADVEAAEEIAADKTEAKTPAAKTTSKKEAATKTAAKKSDKEDKKDKKPAKEKKTPPRAPQYKEQDHATAVLRYVRIAPRKVQVVLDLVRGQSVEKALAILKFTPKAAAELISKLIKSAMANAENNHNLDVGSLYVAYAHAGSGPILKRIRPRAHGRAFRINKKTSHITVTLRERI